MAHYMIVYGTLYFGSLWHIIFLQFMAYYMIVNETLYYGGLIHFLYVNQLVFHVTSSIRVSISSCMLLDVYNSLLHCH